MSGANIWQQRLSTLRAMTYLATARALVRLFPFAWYRWTVGAPSAGPIADEADQSFPPSPGDPAQLARRIERAAMRLPGESKCLAKAIALQWMLRRIGQPGLIVIAVHRRERIARHAYHAWLDHDGAMLVGSCDRADYREVMRFDPHQEAPTGTGAGAA